MVVEEKELEERSDINRKKAEYWRRSLRASKEKEVAKR